jgi:putative transposase
MFLTAHASEIWACGSLWVQMIFFRTIYVFFVVHHASREVLNMRVTRPPTSEWVGQQIDETCSWDRRPPRYPIHDRDSRFGATFIRRVRCLDIRSIRTPFRSPRVNAIVERWVKSV